MEITTGDSAPTAVVEWICDNVRNETIRRCGVGEDVELAVLATQDGVLVGGCYGATWGGTCELEGLWVEPSSRHRGLGRLLLTAAEEEAARRGCHQLVLLTHATRSPGLYERHGFEQAGAVEDYPSGTRAVWWRKTVAPPRASTAPCGDGEERGDGGGGHPFLLPTC